MELLAAGGSEGKEDGHGHGAWDPHIWLDFDNARTIARNILAAYATGYALGISHEKIVVGIGAQHAVPGRFEQIASPQGWMAIVDYAHTPDALERCLHAIRDLLPARKVQQQPSLPAPPSPLKAAIVRWLNEEL